MLPHRNTTDGPLVGPAACQRAHRNAVSPSWSVPPALLDRGLVAGGTGSLFAGLRRRLDQGEPVTIVAIGSSLVAAAAGCNAPLPHLSGCPCPSCCGMWCGGGGSAGAGWAVEVLNWLNASWPHPQHRLYNVGEAGGDVGDVLASCPRSLLTIRRIDLALVDFTTPPPSSQERLLRMLLGFNRGQAPDGPARAPPAIVVPLFAEFTNRKEYGISSDCTSDRRRAPSKVCREPSSLLSVLAAATRAAGGGGAPLASLVQAWHDAPAAETEVPPTLSAVARRGPLPKSSYIWKVYQRSAMSLRLQRRYGFAVVSNFAACDPQPSTRPHPTCHDPPTATPPPPAHAAPPLPHQFSARAPARTPATTPPARTSHAATRTRTSPARHPSPLPPRGSRGRAQVCRGV